MERKITFIVAVLSIVFLGNVKAQQADSFFGKKIHFSQLAPKNGPAILEMKTKDFSANQLNPNYAIEKMGYFSCSISNA